MNVFYKFMTNFKCVDIFIIIRTILKIMCERFFKKHEHLKKRLNILKNTWTFFYKHMGNFHNYMNICTKYEDFLTYMSFWMKNTFWISDNFF